MNQLEANVMNSFRLAKSDIMKVQNAVADLNKRQKQLMKTVTDLKAKNKTLSAQNKKLTAEMHKVKKAAMKNTKARAGASKKKTRKKKR